MHLNEPSNYRELVAEECHLDASGLDTRTIVSISLLAGAVLLTTPTWGLLHCGAMDAEAAAIAKTMPDQQSYYEFFSNSSKNLDTAGFCCGGVAICLAVSSIAVICSK